MALEYRIDRTNRSGALIARVGFRRHHCLGGNGWADVPVDAYELAMAHDSAWVLAEIAAKRARLDAHKFQHRCVGPTIGGGYELSDDEPCLVLRQLAAAESASPAYPAWD
jgi:hypothetical protein